MKVGDVIMKLGDTVMVRIPRSLYVPRPFGALEVESFLNIQLTTPEMLQAAEREDWELVLRLHGQATADS